MKKNKKLCLFLISIVAASFMLNSCSLHKKDPVVLTADKHVFCEIQNLGNYDYDEDIENRGLYNEGLYTVQYGEQGAVLSLFDIDGTMTDEFDLRLPVQMALARIYSYNNSYYAIGYGAVGCILVKIDHEDCSYEVLDQETEYRDIFADDDTIYLVSEYSVATYDKNLKKKDDWNSDDYLTSSTIMPNGIAVCSSDDSGCALIVLDKDLDIISESEIISENDLSISLSLYDDATLCVADDYGMYKVSVNDMKSELLFSYSDYGLNYPGNIFRLGDKILFYSEVSGLNIEGIYCADISALQRRTGIKVLADPASLMLVSGICGMYNMTSSDFFLLPDYLEDYSDESLSRALMTGEYDMYLGDLQFIDRLPDCEDGLDLELSEDINRELVNYGDGKYLLGFGSSGNAYKGNSGNIACLDSFSAYSDLVSDRDPLMTHFKRRTAVYVRDLYFYIDKAVEEKDKETLSAIIKHISDEVFVSKTLIGSMSGALSDDLLFLDSQIEDADQLICMEHYIGSDKLNLAFLSDGLCADSGIAVGISDVSNNKEVIRDFILFMLSESAQVKICQDMFPVNAEAYRAYLEGLNPDDRYALRISQEYDYKTDSEKKDEEDAINEYFTQVEREGTGNHEDLDKLRGVWSISDEDLKVAAEVGGFLIRNTKSVCYCNEDELKIISEELEMLKASPERLDDAATNIMSRLTLYKSER